MINDQIRLASNTNIALTNAPSGIARRNGDTQGDTVCAVRMTATPHDSTRCVFTATACHPAAAGTKRAPTINNQATTSIAAPGRSYCVEYSGRITNGNGLEPEPWCVASSSDSSAQAPDAPTTSITWLLLGTHPCTAAQSMR